MEANAYVFWWFGFDVTFFKGAAEMTEKNGLSHRQIRREREILEKFPAIKKRAVPISLFIKLLDASEYAINHGYVWGLK